MLDEIFEVAIPWGTLAVPGALIGSAFPTMGLGAAVVTNMNPAVAALISNGSAVAAATNGLRPLVGGR